MSVVLSTTRRAGIAGQLSITANVEYEGDGDGPQPVQFVGSIYGGPVVMVTPLWQTFVTEPGRFGQFGDDPHEWVRRFFA